MPRVLLVDRRPDSPTAAALREAGHLVAHVRTAPHALWAAGDRRIDLLVCDLDLPDAPAPRLASVIRSRLRIPVLFLGEGDDLPPGAACLPRPFTPEDLRAAVDGLLAGTAVA